MSNAVVKSGPEEANLIAQQLTQCTRNPHNRLKAMIGAKNFSYDSRKAANLTFHFAGKAKKINFTEAWVENPKKKTSRPNCLKIELDASTDYYTMTFGNIYGGRYFEAEPIPMLGWEQLKDVFESTTGLYLSL